LAYLVEVEEVLWHEAKHLEAVLLPILNNYLDALSLEFFVFAVSHGDV